jgi:hypothetical protein
MVKIKHNEQEGCTELWIDGAFSASWREIHIPLESKGAIEHMIQHAVEHAVEQGKLLNQADVRKALGLP